MNELEVTDYLLANSEFFARHAELLATVKLANPHGKVAISLQERQMEMLRDKNKLLARRLAEMLRYGHENDGLSTKFIHWISRMIAERAAHALPRAIASGLAEVFDVPQTALRTWDVADTYATRRPNSRAASARKYGCSPTAWPRPIMVRTRASRRRNGWRRSRRSRPRHWPRVPRLPRRSRARPNQSR